MGCGHPRHSQRLVSLFMKHFFLLDCNNFFVSCERVFNPVLRNKPVVVLSSNDACIIARSPEAKALGIPMGAAAWEYEAFFKRHNVLVYSANFALYGDMSARIMQTITQLASDIEIYSVDEAFFHVHPYSATSLANKNNYYHSYAQSIQQTVKQRTGIPVSIGIGSTKTLAKIANYIAKKNPQHGGVFDITQQHDIDTLLAKIPVEEIWGVGYRYAKLLHSKNINTVRDFKYADDAWIRKKMTIVGYKTLLEIRGKTILSLATIPEPKQSITVSRLFGTKTPNAIHIRQALAAYVTSAAQKLRVQQSAAYHISVFLITTRHHDPDHVFTSSNCSLEIPTAYTPALITAAQSCLDQLLIPGVVYKKVGVIISDIVPDSSMQLSTYAPTPNIDKQTHIMKAIDHVNKKLGRNKVSFAAAGIVQPWKMKQLKKSQCFTTSWHELLEVRV